MHRGDAEDAEKTEWRMGWTFPVMRFRADVPAACSLNVLCDLCVSAVGPLAGP